MTETSRPQRRTNRIDRRAGGLADRSDGTAPIGGPVWEAGRLARHLPDDLHCVAILRASGSRSWDRPAVVTLATELGKRRTYTLLGNLGSSADGLDSYLGVRGSAGLTDVALGWDVVANVAVPSWIHGFIYLPAGDDALPAPDLTGTPAFRRLVARVRKQDSLLLLFCPAGLSPGTFPRGLLDGYVFFGDAEQRPVLRPAVPLLGAVHSTEYGEPRRERGRTLLVRGRIAADDPISLPAGNAGTATEGRGSTGSPATGPREEPGRASIGKREPPASRSSPFELVDHGAPPPRSGRPRIPATPPPREQGKRRRRFFGGGRARSRVFQWLIGAMGVLVTVALALYLSWLIVRYGPAEEIVGPWEAQAEVGTTTAP